MKKYSVNVHYDYVACVEVEADNEDEALDKAKEIADNLPIEQLEYCDDIDACVTDVEDDDDKLNRYVMSYSQADNADMVVYAHSYEQAEEIFENGTYTLEEKEK